MAHPSDITDALLFTSAAYAVIGVVLVAVSLWIWFTSPYKRAFLFGPYVTPEGVKLLLANWPFVFLFGAFIFSCGIEHFAHWMFAYGLASANLVRFLGIVEAMISVVTAASIVFVMGRKWLEK